jgi:hypothetical protein
MPFAVAIEFDNGLGADWPIDTYEDIEYLALAHEVGQRHIL